MMTSFLVAAGAFVLLVTAIGLVRLFRGPGNADRMMAAQLFGTGGIAGLLLFSGQSSSALDLALILALLSAFASAAFALGAPRSQDQ